LAQAFLAYTHQAISLSAMACCLNTPCSPGLSDKSMAYVAVGCESVPLSTHGLPVAIENEHFEGTVFFTHRPASCSGEDFAHAALLEASGSAWELQIQGRFKTEPSVKMRCGGELPRLPLGLGSVMKSMCRFIFTDVTFEKQRNGSEMLHAPIIESRRLFRAEDPIALPIVKQEPEGTWEWCDGEWCPLDRMTDYFDTKHYFAFSFNSPHIDFERWRATGIPGIGSLDLSRFFGSKGFSVSLFDDATDGSSSRCFVDLRLIPPCARGSDMFMPNVRRGSCASTISTSSFASASTDMSSYPSGVTDGSSFTDTTSPDSQAWEFESDEGNPDVHCTDEIGDDKLVPRRGKQPLRRRGSLPQIRHMTLQNCGYDKVIMSLDKVIMSL